jgi:hypothetical protein
MDAISKHFTETQLAQSLNLLPRTLQKWRQEGKGPLFVRIGRSIRYPKPETEAFLKSMLRQATDGR